MADGEEKSPIAITPRYPDDRRGLRVHATTVYMYVCIVITYSRVQINRKVANPVHRFSLSMEMSRLTRDGTAEPVSRDQILRYARGQGNIHFPCSADHEQDWQPYPVDPYSAICDDHTYISQYIHTYIHT